MGRTLNEDLMIPRIALAASVVLAPCMLISGRATAQDVPGIEICTVEKTMERRTSCLQSNVDFLHKTLTKLSADHQQKLDAARAQIEGLKSTIAALQKTVDDLQAAQKKAAEDQKKKTDAPPAKDAPPPAPVKDAK
jgi:septal ring factor EnvC (AmiA/AmiB activator)